MINRDVFLRRIGHIFHNYRPIIIVLYLHYNTFYYLRTSQFYIVFFFGKLQQFLLTHIVTIPHFFLQIPI